jgi:1-acyl-sn-glycerol-3-phosphate acyltransferase
MPKRRTLAERATRAGLPPAGSLQLRDARTPHAPAPLYDRYFRVRSSGHQHLPREGAAILLGNHGGELPLDGMMLWTDVLRHTDPPRVPRIIADNFVAALPFVGTIFSRGGVVTGSRGNVHRLLERGEIAAIFPDGLDFGHDLERDRLHFGGVLDGSKAQRKPG